MDASTNIFHLIGDAAKKARVRLILIGGFAVNLYHYARNTRDVDFLVTEENYQKLSKILAVSGYEELVRTNVFAKQQLKNPKAMPIDFLFVDDHTFELIWTHGKAGVFSDPQNHFLRIPSLLHLMALKLHAMKQGSKDRVWKDLPDIINLIKANRFDIQSPDFQRICQQYGPEGVYATIMEMTSGEHNGRS